jgi:hypothetical protein
LPSLRGGHIIKLTAEISVDDSASHVIPTAPCSG